jgi:hypothetical protein
LEFRVLIEKLIKIGDTNTIIRRSINMMCSQETKWVGEKSREIEHTKYREIKRNRTYKVCRKRLK